MSTPELAQEAFSIIEAEIRRQRSLGEFEMAYQARVAIEKIRFAIAQIDQAIRNPEIVTEIGIQLTDALDRLEAADRHFQERFRCCKSRNGGHQRNERDQRV